MLDRRHFMKLLTLLPGLPSLKQQPPAESWNDMVRVAIPEQGLFDVPVVAGEDLKLGDPVFVTAAGLITTDPDEAAPDSSSIGNVFIATKAG